MKKNLGWQDYLDSIDLVVRSILSTRQ